jgi:hypothetical protein
MNACAFLRAGAALAFAVATLSSGPAVSAEPDAAITPFKV